MKARGSIFGGLVMGTMCALATASISAPIATVSAAAPRTPSPSERQSSGLAKKSADAEERAPSPLLATLVQTHTDERVPLDTDEPSQERFDQLLADRVTGTVHSLDARLLGLLRTLASRHPGARIELVSGFRSPKLNELLRKKGHHVASHSQHSLGHACDFRIVPPGATKGIHPRELEKEIRKLGWQGGTGVYIAESDWFVHADVGPRRNWVN